MYKILYGASCKYFNRSNAKPALATDAYQQAPAELRNVSIAQTRSLLLLHISREQGKMQQDVFQSLKRGVQLTHLWKSGISPISDRRAFPQKHEQVTFQWKCAVFLDQNTNTSLVSSPAGRAKIEQVTSR
ncbi:hypothetical protein [Reticulibacter mediterranei]|uniref:hypothetical protein n=1 Tax=Reticulibacter mediterranei TaxID=2778369 RepID=UPI004032FAB7